LVYANQVTARKRTRVKNRLCYIYLRRELCKGNISGKYFSATVCYGYPVNARSHTVKYVKVCCGRVIGPLIIWYETAVPVSMFTVITPLLLHVMLVGVKSKVRLTTLFSMVVSTVWVLLKLPGFAWLLPGSYRQINCLLQYYW
jgi:hypothetical protein